MVKKALLQQFPFDEHYIKALRETEFEKSISLEVPLYDKVCFAGLPILKLKKFNLKNSIQNIGFMMLEDSELNYARRMLGSLKLFNSFVGRKTPL